RRTVLLHSFPTRRSSDLGEMQNREGEGFQQGFFTTHRSSSRARIQQGTWRRCRIEPGPPRSHSTSRSALGFHFRRRGPGQISLGQLRQVLAKPVGHGHFLGEDALADLPGLSIANGFGGGDENGVGSDLQILEDVTRLRSFRSEEHTSELQSRENLVCRLLLEKKKESAGTRAS